MELARPIGGGSSTNNPSIFDVLAHEGTLSILKRLSVNKKLKVVLFCADLVAVAWGRGRMTELLFGLQRGEDGRLWRVAKFLIETFWEEYGNGLIKQYKWIDKSVTGLDVLFKLLYITGDSNAYGLLHRLLRIKYTQSSPNDALRWALFLGQLLLNLHSQFSQKRPSSAVPLSEPPHLPSISSQQTRPGICPGCCASLSGRGCLFMRPEKGILHCSLSCLGNPHSEIITVYL